MRHGAPRGALDPTTARFDRRPVCRRFGPWQWVYWQPLAVFAVLVAGGVFREPYPPSDTQPALVVFVVLTAVPGLVAAVVDAVRHPSAPDPRSSRTTDPPEKRSVAIDVSVRLLGWGMAAAVISLPLPFLLKPVVGQEWANMALPAALVGLVVALAIILVATVAIMCGLTWFAVRSIGSAVTTLESAPTARRAAQARVLAAFKPRQARAGPPGVAAEISGGNQAAATGHPWSDLGLGIWLLGLLTLLVSIVAVPSVSHVLAGGSRAGGIAALLRLVWWAITGNEPSAWAWTVRVALVAFVGGGALLVAPWFRGSARDSASTE